MQVMSFEQHVRGTTAPPEVLAQLVVVSIPFIDLMGNRRGGQLVVHASLAQELTEIFRRLRDEQFPIARMVSPATYAWDDERSMGDNNTSAFNYRTIAGTDRLSKHSLGRAVDINPLFNPYIASRGTSPQGAIYVPTRAGTITADSTVVKIFANFGWSWGGHWLDRKDYQHFEKS
jgi:peptidoglycan L-alanyl-D-glutamate endopeptidase CwlK